MNERMQRILADLKARQDAGEHMACPRCGCDTMKPAIYTNALSRQADIMVCDDCGMSEAKLAFMGNPMPLTQWACFRPRRPDGDFKAVTGEEAWAEIQETQLDYLKDVFTAWISGDTQDDFAEQRIDVKERCKGLKEIWEQPFMVTYDVHEQMKQNASKDPQIISGALHGAINIGRVRKRAQGGKYITIGVHRKDWSEEDYYPAYVEFGHGGPGPAPSHPYIRPAYDVTEDEAYELIRDGLREALDRLR